MMIFMSPCVTKAEVKVEPEAEVKVEQPPLRVSGPLRRISEDAGIRRDSMELTPSMIRSTMMKTGQCIIELFLERLDSASPQNNVGSATKVPQDSKKSNAAKRVKCESKNTNDVIMEEEYDLMAMSVPDADFYNFEKDRVEASFGENQVWAAYDDYGMPRWYALVHKVVSQEPFKTCISWLDGKKNGYVGSMKKWIDSGQTRVSTVKPSAIFIEPGFLRG
ncbi:unnamed protein product [Arabidopsis lyrata]|nr:unnamed protein product [Arabidopsis lyrata]